jgi:two-component sensor histidine kinase
MRNSVKPFGRWLPRSGDLSSPEACSNDQYVLLREQHHRMANTLTLLSAMLRSEFHEAADLTVDQVLERHELRLVAFGNLHRLLTVGAPTGYIDLGEYLEDLCEALSAAVLNPLGLRCQVSVTDCNWPRENCERLGLVVTELVMNAAKYAFDGSQDGVVRVEFDNSQGGWLCTVSDNGQGVTSSTAGVGSRIVTDIARAMGARVLVRSSSRGTSVMVAPAAQKSYG